MFSPARRTARQLLRLAREAHVPAQVEQRGAPVRRRAAALAAVEQGLFAPRLPNCGTAGAALRLHTASSPYAEVEWAAA